MTFIDEVRVCVRAGRGGDGCLSFHRTRRIPRGGPDGGNGGRGGSVYLEVAEGMQTLADYRHRPSLRAGDGRPGRNNRCSGRNGGDLRVCVPPGTRVFDEETGEPLGELLVPADTLQVACGGAGGFGNARFKSIYRRALRRVTPGEPGEERHLRLELILLADVGLIGLPNAGKSSLLQAVSSARPRVADYPFTTRSPELGIVELGWDERFAAADVPGLIRGAANGAGLGLRFLRHLSRTRLLVHVVDLAAGEEADELAGQVRVIEEELAGYDRRLLDVPRWLALNKIDRLEAASVRQRRDRLLAELAWNDPAYLVSARDGRGCRELCQAAVRYLHQQPSHPARA